MLFTDLLSEIDGYRLWEVSDSNRQRAYRTPPGVVPTSDNDKLY